MSAGDPAEVGSLSVQLERARVGNACLTWLGTAI